MHDENRNRVETLYVAMAQQVMPLWLGIPANEIFAALFELMIQAVLGAHPKMDRTEALAIVMKLMNGVAANVA